MRIENIRLSGRIYKERTEDLGTKIKDEEIRGVFRSFDLDLEGLLFHLMEDYLAIRF